ncbi:MAG: hypothetical protein ACU84Q_02660 [Gammaproteobacteria bacterium]
MNKSHYPLYFAVVGTILLVIIGLGAQIGSDGHTKIPLLALLAICEFGFFFSLAGGYFSLKGLRQRASAQRFATVVAFIVLAGLFAIKGLGLWPH